MLIPSVLIAALASLTLLAATLTLKLRRARAYAAQLCESERRLEAAQRLGRMGWWRADMSTGLTELSTELHRVFETAEGDELTEDYFLAIIHEDDRDPVMATTEQAIADRAPREVHFRISTAVGNERRCMTRVEPEFGPDGELLCLNGFTQDVTEKWETEQSLHRLAAVVQQSPDAIVRLDVEGRIESWNPAAEELYGYTEAEVLGRPISITMPAETADSDLAEILEKVLAGATMHSEAIRATKHGERIPVEVMASPLRDPSSGKLLGASAFLRDLRPALRAREERDQLEQRLQQSQRLETVGQLAGGIAHDFNNLLAVILNYTDFVREELPEGSQIRDDVDQIGRAAERATALTRQLLLFSRRELVRADVLDLNTVVGDMQKLLHRTLGEDVELTVIADDSIGAIHADQGQVEQVLMNLALNARDAMPDGGQLTIHTAEVTVDAEAAQFGRGLEPGRYVRLSVTDTGTGMSPDVATKAFDPFFTTKEKGRGTGLGLATVYGIVSEAGGSITIYSEGGLGTTMRVYWPVLLEADEGNEAPEAPRGSGQTLLVVDDDDAVRTSAARILTAGGYTVLAASSAEQALTLCEENTSIRAVVSDVVLHGTLDHQLAEHVDALGRDLKLIFMSGYGGHNGVDETGHPRIEKPFTSDALLRSVGEALAEAQREGRRQ
jgi:two-component system, cell cycle sensor histidine kinase and response regulator CckA